jgi:hypothetical protein
LWFDQSFVGRRIDGDRLLYEAEEEFPSSLRLSAVKAEREFIEIILQMRRRNGTLVGS